MARVVGAGRTDADGRAEIEVIYPKSAGLWTEIQLRVTITTTAGTEFAAQEQFWLPALAADLVVSQAPPGVNAPTGPYGSAGSCANPN